MMTHHPLPDEAVSRCQCYQGRLPDYNDPVVLPKERNTVEDFCNRIHKVSDAAISAKENPALITLLRTCHSILACLLKGPCP